jgi:alkanesulfonate monooxygenase SsuD/methylene tetrahydromethanopterin reductase-like flavin-dependent oxidoreductase (luciferase family)
MDSSRKGKEHARQHHDPGQRSDGSRWRADGPDHNLCHAGRSSRLSRCLDWRFVGPRSTYSGFASGVDGGPAVTSKVELGISVLQLPLRNPVELAHRVQSLQAMSKNRLILGVGSGSTRDDFELLGYDYDHRFRTFRNDLEIMNKVWTGEPVNGGRLAVWPGCEGGPPILIGAWRSPRWITYAAKQAQGWTPSGRYSSLEDLEAGMKIYREQGGTNAVLANCSVDLQQHPESAELAKLASVNFICPPDEARRRINRVKEMGFDEILIGSQFGAIEEIERIRV